MRLIDADALPVTTLTDGGYWTKNVVYKADIDAAPTISPDSLREHGRWIISSDGYYPYCSRCNTEPKGGMSDFCPSCGARMDLEG